MLVLIVIELSVGVGIHLFKNKKLWIEASKEMFAVAQDRPDKHYIIDIFTSID